MLRFIQDRLTYWDQLGWKDVYASKAFTARQYAYAKAWHSRSVYTPCFVRNGREWRRGDATPTPSADAGNLHVVWQDNHTCRITYSASTNRQQHEYSVTVALLGSGIRNDVRAGENAGRQLAHEFVVLQTATTRLTTDEGGDDTALVILPKTKLPPAPQHALAVWITSAGGLAPLQTTGGWLD